MVTKLMARFGPDLTRVSLVKPILAPLSILWKGVACFFLDPSAKGVACFFLDPSATQLPSLSHKLTKTGSFCHFLCGFLGKFTMGLSSFPTAAEGVLPVLVLNTVLSLALIKNMVRSVLQGMGSNYWTRQDFEPDPDDNARERRVSITQFKSLCHSSDDSAGSVGGSCNKGWATTVECCVCLCRFEAEEEVSELSCKHFFHKGCLDKWFDNKHSTCPLCRSVL